MDDNKMQCTDWNEYEEEWCTSIATHECIYCGDYYCLECAENRDYICRCIIPESRHESISIIREVRVDK